MKCLNMKNKLTLTLPEIVNYAGTEHQTKKLQNSKVIKHSFNPFVSTFHSKYRHAVAQSLSFPHPQFPVPTIPKLVKLYIMGRLLTFCLLGL